MRFSYGARTMPAEVQYAIAVPLEAAVRRMPDALVAAAVDVSLERCDGRADEWLWRSSSGGGRITLSPLAATTTALVVQPDTNTSGALTDALTVELHGALE